MLKPRIKPYNGSWFCFDRKSNTLGEGKSPVGSWFAMYEKLDYNRQMEVRGLELPDHTISTCRCVLRLNLVKLGENENV